MSTEEKKNVSAYEALPGVFQEEFSPEGRLKVSFGPQHPGSGHMRIILTINGDIVEDAIPDVGYVHRGLKRCANTRITFRTYPILRDQLFMIPLALRFLTFLPSKN